ncbi:hypothetical protein O181_034015 [Austropuccinia psidii MF-1]|uniref:Uncharacterized protein n=1 Tax=Austropuccinia psidii MF-1 TaxID=1389203 RepID=A0A9Q3D433_9BASI|nr:hypothetical protein [Austropuccinia psidii MF-1]
MAMTGGHLNLGLLSPRLITHGIQMLRHNPSNPLREDTPVPHMPHKKTLWKLTPVLKPSQHNEPPIPGPSQSSESHEKTLACEPEHEVALMQSMEDPFGKSPLSFFSCSKLSLTPPSTISSSSRYGPLCNYHQQFAHQIPPSPSSTPTLVPPQQIPSILA